MKYLLSGITREDTSKSDLRDYKSLGYNSVVFVANLSADPQCKDLNGNIYDIDELLVLDNPIFRIAHPNCQCKFQPYSKEEQKSIPTSFYTTKTESSPETTESNIQKPNNLSAQYRTKILKRANYGNR